MAKRKVGRPRIFADGDMVFEAFKLSKALKKKFNKLTFELGHNKSEILRDAIEDYINKEKKKLKKSA